MSAKEDIAAEVLAALKEDDAAALAAALEAFVYECEDGGDEEAEEGKKPVLGIMIGKK